MPWQLTDDLRQEYINLFTGMSIRPARLSTVKAIGARIAREQAKYTSVEQKTNVPWVVVGIIHQLESSGRFDRHLHNGDPLERRTVRVPRGRPRSGTPPFTWDQSAIDALTQHQLDQWNDWSFPGIAFQLELYNGMGYRKHHPHVKSPYLWSFGSVYSSGKYVRDGIFSADAVSQQCGGMVLLKYLLDSGVNIGNITAGDVHDDDNLDASVAIPLGDEGEQDFDDSGPRYPGQYLQLGLRDNADVERVQDRLAELGCNPGVSDGNFGETTKHAVMLFQARSADLAGRPLEIDGVIGAKSWAALFGPDTVENVTPAQLSNFTETLLQIAEDEVGVTESPLGSNRGRRVEEFQNSVGPWCVGQPWCMCFIFWCHREAAKRLNVQNKAPKTGGVLDAWRQSQQTLSGGKIVTAAEARDDMSLVRPGMVFFLRTSDTTGHVGIVVSNDDGLLETIEGNTNQGGHREGIGVYRRTQRRVSQINLGFASFE